MRTKLGRFFISETLLRRGIDGDQEMQARTHAIFQKFIPIEAKFHWDRRATEYLGYSNEFDDVPQGEVAPTYDVETAKVESVVGGGGAVVETYTVKFVRL